ncbi:glycoside hydrolase family 15 protein [Subsaximicrobium wynnwilliamsii]|uniref:Glycoside hydrolase family 15 protein n=1 Tax=Subsaximicrobium wynnwilliamsii TaxID=291179 RepID=A0A5C6ZPA5_9FLAO|nr:glycoside hydrolase family 15 protein [Subsaximicrobium wynnwilliamsii]TXD84819.1 glycoside hydrolase family 15 protein [Subsaximicrobium wynnwilliamsii]TXD90490.1 glycoside hydrolase family 15 protein [Subsaximicrobium wynnwilliamsii]TXE04965.1 glycoside hydrolase family 15 protein [Subsaximicrobium wynnwilliamsii]
MKDNLNYGIIGNCKSAALISKHGSLDWCCLPEFDSSSVFAKLLDEKIGGSFGVIVADDYEISQTYITDTCILKTRFASEANIFEILDFMPRYKKENGEYYAPPEVIRYFKLIKGQPKFKINYDPKLEYAVGKTSTYVKTHFIVSLTDKGRYDTLFLYTDFDKEAVVNGEELTLKADGFFRFGYNEKLFEPSISIMNLELERTKVYWLNWMQRTPSYKNYNAEISRSALTLKLLSYEKTGAVLAAATTSLPETIGEVRNWDYRFCWIRDASMVIKVVSQLGHKRMAKRYLKFIVDLIPHKDEKLQIMYGINGEKKLTEKKLDHLSGYMNSKPVRIGNAAYSQRQNDIYGILMDVIHQQLVKFEMDVENGEELWTITKGIVWVVDKHWQEADKGIWEFRTEDRHFTFSKVLCWVAVDRAIKVAKILGKTHKLEKWQPLEAEIKKDILDKAWNEDVQSFTQSYGSTDLDASTLLMEPYGFIDAKDPKYMYTVKAIEKELSNDGLLYRYKNKDDFGLPSSSFTICTFWFINSLYKIGETQKAKKLFDQLLSYSNHLGLFSEDIDFETKRLLGNFPQAYSHLALIETAINLSNITDEESILESLEH